MPEKIKWNNTIFTLRIDALDDHLYYEENEGLQQSLVSMLRTMQDLNDEIEVIKKQDIDIQELKELTCEEGDYKTRTINELIKAVKQLDNKINKE